VGRTKFKVTLVVEFPERIKGNMTEAMDVEVLVKRAIEDTLRENMEVEVKEINVDECYPGEQR